MQIDEEARKLFGIAQTFDELCQMSQTATLGGEAGYPVIIIPFGALDRKSEIYVPNEATLHSVGLQALQRGMFGFVHVVKARVRE